MHERWTTAYAWRLGVNIGKRYPTKLAQRRILIGSLDRLGVVLIHIACTESEEYLSSSEVVSICECSLNHSPFSPEHPHNLSSSAFLLASFLVIISLLSSLKVTYICTHIISKTRPLPPLSPLHYKQDDVPKTTPTSPQTPM